MEHRNIDSLIDMLFGNGANRKQTVIESRAMPDGRRHYPIVIAVPETVPDIGVGGYLRSTLNIFHDRMQQGGFFGKRRCHCAAEHDADRAMQEANATMGDLERLSREYLDQNFARAMQFMQEYEDWTEAMSFAFTHDNAGVIAQHKAVYDAAIERFASADPVGNPQCEQCEGAGEYLCYGIAQGIESWRVGGMFDGMLFGTGKVVPSIAKGRRVFNHGPAHETYANNMRTGESVLRDCIFKNMTLPVPFVTIDALGVWEQPAFTVRLVRDPETDHRFANTGSIDEWGKGVQGFYADNAQRWVISVDALIAE